MTLDPAPDTRRRHQDVRSAVRRATLGLVEDQPFKDLSVEEIARAAGLSRSAFYFYFRDKRDLLMAVAEEVADDLYREADRWWHGEGPPETLISVALEGAVAVYERHAGLIRVATEVSTYDEEVGRFWRELMGRFVVATADHLRREQTAGRMRPLDPDTTAESLVWMMERCCYMYIARGERSARELIDSLTAVWAAALYPGLEAPAGTGASPPATSVPRSTQARQSRAQAATEP